MNSHRHVAITDEELSQWAATRADDAGRLARELVRRRSEILNLVIAAREFWDIHNDLSTESDSLDKALEPFSELVPYENEPDATLHYALVTADRTDNGKEELIRDLVKALKPFATECNTWPDDQAPDDYRIKVKLETKVIQSKLTVGDLRCARSALTRAAEAGYGETP